MTRLSVMTVMVLLQLPLIMKKFIFFQFTGKNSIRLLLGLNLWNLLKYTELIEVEK